MVWIFVVILGFIIIALVNYGKSSTPPPSIKKKYSDSDLTPEDFIQRNTHVKNYDISMSKSDNGKVTMTLDFEASKTNVPYYVVFDLETTGLPPRVPVSEKNYMRFPRIVQIAWIVLDENFDRIIYENHIIKQEKEIPYESVLIHGITDEIAAEKGVEISVVLDEFLQDIADCEFLVAHNIEFDYNILKSELYRLKKKKSINKRTICTMQKGILFCKIYKRDALQLSELYDSEFEYKYPKLEELVKKCFFENHKGYFKMNNLHNALTDATWTAKCLQKMINVCHIDIEAEKNRQVVNAIEKKTADPSLFDEIEKLIKSIKFVYLIEDKDYKVKDLLEFKESVDTKTFYDAIFTGWHSNDVKEVSFDYEYLPDGKFKIQRKYVESGSLTTSIWEGNVPTKEERKFYEAGKLEEKNTLEAVRIYTEIIGSEHSTFVVYHKTIKRLSIILRKLKRYDLDVFVLENVLKMINNTSVDEYDGVRQFIFQGIEPMVVERLEASRKKIK